MLRGASVTIVTEAWGIFSDIPAPGQGTRSAPATQTGWNDTRRKIMKRGLAPEIDPGASSIGQGIRELQDNELDEVTGVLVVIAIIAILIGYY